MCETTISAVNAVWAKEYYTVEEKYLLSQRYKDDLVFDIQKLKINVDDYYGWCGVFFGERLAYTVFNPNQVFYEDLHNGQMESVGRQGKYFRKVR